VLTILALFFRGKRSERPAVLGRPYTRGER